MRTAVQCGYDFTLGFELNDAPLTENGATNRSIRDFAFRCNHVPEIS